MKFIVKKAGKILRKIGLSGYNRKKNLQGLHPLVISTVVIIFTAFLSHLLRKFVRKWMSPGIVRTIVLEFIATADLCGCCYELVIIADNYGVTAYGIYLFLLTVWWSQSWEDVTACPYNRLEEVVEGGMDIQHALMLILSQVLGGAIIFKYIGFIWSLELAETHVGRASGSCTTDLQVSMIAGALVEGLATCVIRIMSRSLCDTQIKYANVADAFFATALVVAAFNFSGGYYNPVLATSLKYGCVDSTFAEHLIVYWIGASIGSIASIYIYKSPVIQNCVGGLKQKTD